MPADVAHWFPSPEEVLQRSVDDLRTVGLSRRKAEYIRAVAQWFTAPGAGDSSAVPLIEDKATTSDFDRRYYRDQPCKSTVAASTPKRRRLLRSASSAATVSAAGISPDSIRDCDKRRSLIPHAGCTGADNIGQSNCSGSEASTAVLTTPRTSPAYFARRTDEEILAELTKIRGVGSWTVSMFLIFGLKRLDVLPVGDLGVRKGFKVIFNLDGLPDPATMERLAQPYRPYRSILCYYMWKLGANAPDVASD